MKENIEQNKNTELTERKAKSMVEPRVSKPILIKQKFKGDCAAASLAMFLGVTYDELIKHFPKEYEEKFVDGIWNSRIFEVASKVYGKELLCYKDNFDLTKPSLVVADSLNYEGRKHTMYWDGKNIYDPALGKCYDDLPKNIAYIFQTEE